MSSISLSLWFPTLNIKKKKPLIQAQEFRIYDYSDSGVPAVAQWK